MQYMRDISPRILRKTTVLISIISLTAIFFFCIHYLLKISGKADNFKKHTATAPMHSQQIIKDLDPATRISIEQSYSKMPLSFEANNGQVDKSVKFLSKGCGFTLFLTSTDVVLSRLHRTTDNGTHFFINATEEPIRAESVLAEVIRLLSLIHI